MLVVLDLMLIGYYKIKQGILQQNFSKHYRLKAADIPCKHFNKYINTLKKEKEEEMQENIHG